MVFCILTLVYTLIGGPVGGTGGPLICATEIGEVLMASTVISTTTCTTTFFTNNRGETLFNFTLALTFVPFLILVNGFVGTPVRGKVERCCVGSTGGVLGTYPSLGIVKVANDCNGADIGCFLSATLGTGCGILVAPRDCGAPVNIIGAVERRLHPARRVFIYRVNTEGINSVGRVYSVIFPSCKVVASVNRRRLRSFGSVSGVIGAGFRLCSTIPSGGGVFLGNSGRCVSTGLTGGPGTNFRACKVNDRGRACTDSVHMAEGKADFSIIYNSRGVRGLRAPLINRRGMAGLVNIITIYERLNIRTSSVGVRLGGLASPPRELRLAHENGATVVSSTCGSGPTNYRTTLGALTLFRNRGVLVAPNVIRLNGVRSRCGCRFNGSTTIIYSRICLINGGRARTVCGNLTSNNVSRSTMAVDRDFVRTFGRTDTSPTRGVVLVRGSLPSGC